MANLDFSFNGVSASSKYFETGRYFNDLLARQEESIIDIPKVSGRTQLMKKFGRREIEIRGVLYANSSSQLLTRIKDFKTFLYHDSDKRLIFNDNSSVYYNAQFLEKIELQKKGNFVPLRLLFTCNDPFGYAVTEDSDLKAGVTTNGYTWNIINNGQDYAYCIVTITFNQAQEHIYVSNNTITDCRLDITNSFSASDVLVINSKTMRINKNSSYSPTGLGDGGENGAEFPIVKVGTNEFEIGTDDATLNVDVKVTFNKTYL